MPQKYGSFRKWEKDYEKEIYTDVYDSFGNGDDRLLIRIKNPDDDMLYYFSTENARILEGFSTESAQEAEGDISIAVGDKVEISYRGLIDFDEEHPDEAVKIVVITVE